MNETKKIIISIAGIILLLNTSMIFGQSYQASTKHINTIRADIESQRIPAGTHIKIRFENSVNTENSSKGDSFIGTITQDIKINNNIVLPKGTMVRGRVGKLKKNNYLSRGAELALIFDHIVTPIGKQVSINAQISSFKGLTLDGTLSAGGGYIDAIEKNIDEGVNTLVNITNKGVKFGLSSAGGYPVILTAPLAVGAGAMAGGGIFFGKSISALYKKGDNVRVSTGDIMEIAIINNLDIPVN